jgi:hypothetical protein
LQKKELAEEYWPRLLKDSKKVHFLKTDFDRVSFGGSCVTAEKKAADSHTTVGG